MPTSPPIAAWYVRTKLQPPLLRSDLIRRPHLEEALRRAVSDLPLTLLSAPAGYGKTTLLANLAHLLPDRKLAWVTLDAEENDPVRFVGLVTTALQRLHPDCGRSVWPWLSGGATEVAGLKRAIAALIEDILTCLPEPFILVLDDLHFVTEPAVYIALEYLLEHQVPQMHIAVGTRYDPPLRLTRLAARRQLGELRRPDLGFSPEETSALLNESLGLRLTAAEVEILQDRTEGWPAGLCLLAGPLRRLGQDRSQFMAALVHSERYAFDFLAEEVLREMAPDRRRFLLQTAVLAEMSPSVCRAVTGREDSADLLDGLYRQNLTIASIGSETADREGEPVYRHHALFARLLLRQLEREMPGDITELHRRAAQAQPTPGRAIGHYLAAGLWDEAVTIIIRHGNEMLHRGMSETIRAWQNALPAETRAQFPRLTALLARCEIHRGDFAAAGPLLRQALEQFRADGDRLGESEALTSLITVSYATDDREAAATYADAAMLLPLSPMSQAAPRLARAWLKLEEGDWEGIRQQIEEALTIIRQTGNGIADLIGVTYLSTPLLAVPGCMEPVERYCMEAAGRALPETAWRMGADELSIWPMLWRGQTAEALARAEGVDGLRRRLGGYPYIGNDVAVQLGLLHLARGDREAAAQATERLVERMEGAGASRWSFHLHAAGRAMAHLGRLAEARALLARLAALPVTARFMQYQVGHLTGLLALLDGQMDSAAAALDRAAALEADMPIAWVSGSARLLRARLLLEQGKPDQALAAATPVLTAWADSGRPGSALIDGPAILPVLGLAARRGMACAVPMVALFQGQGQESLAPPRPSAPAALIEPLTQREEDVLRLIVAGRTNKQIGQELYITEETVKTHVAHILRKLDLTSRTQAAMRGRELGY